MIIEDKSEILWNNEKANTLEHLSKEIFFPQSILFSSNADLVVCVRDHNLYAVYFREKSYNILFFVKTEAEDEKVHDFYPCLYLPTFCKVRLVILLQVIQPFPCVFHPHKVVTPLAIHLVLHSTDRCSLSDRWGAWSLHECENE